MSGRIKCWVGLGVLAFCCALGAEEPRDKPDVKREEDWRARPIYLLKVTPKEAGKTKVTDGKLLPKRIYARSEPRIFRVDEATDKKIVTGGLGVDFTNTESKFLEEPHRLLRIGSVVPGSLLGDTDDRNYQFTAGEGTFAERFKPTKLGVKYKVMNFYEDGSVTEAVFGPGIKSEH